MLVSSSTTHFDGPREPSVHAATVRTSRDALPSKPPEVPISREVTVEVERWFTSGARVPT